MHRTLPNISSQFKLPWLPLVLALLVATAATTPAHAEKVVDRIVATVNGRVITSNEVNFRLAPVFAQLSAQYPRQGEEFVAKFEEEREAIIEQLIERELVVHAFEDLGARIPDRAVDDDVEMQIKRAYNGDREKFLEELAKSNMTLRSYHESTKNKLIVQAMRAEKFTRGVAVTPSEARAHYNKVKHEKRDRSADTLTFIKLEIPEIPANPSLTPDDQIDLIEELKKKALAGDDMAKLAKEYSSGPNAEAGGLWENMKRSDLNPMFSAIAFDSSEGTIIGPLNSPGKLILIKILKKGYGPPPPFSEIKKEMENEVRIGKSTEPYNRWLERQRKRAIIRRFDKKN